MAKQLNYQINPKYKVMKSQNNYDYLFKFIIVGDSNVGKSCLLLRFTEQIFKKDHEPTLGVEFASKIIEIDGLTIKNQIWDTAGQESFKAITRSYYKGSIAAFLVFDITKRESFESLHKWLYQVKNHSHDKIQIFVLGNKSDLKTSRQVTQEQAQTFARNNDFSYYEVSALSGEKVEQVFLKMSQTILKKINSKQLNADAQSSLGIRKGKKQKKEIISQKENDKVTLNGKPSKSSGCCS